MKCPICRTHNTEEAKFCDECGAKLEKKRQVEKRKLQRRRLINYLHVVEQDTGEHVGFLMDITIQGLMVMSEFPLEVDKTYPLKIFLPADYFKKRFINLVGKSEWCNKELKSGYYESGFELSDPSPKDVEEIENILNTLTLD